MRVRILCCKGAGDGCIFAHLVANLVYFMKYEKIIEDRYVVLKPLEENMLGGMAPALKSELTSLNVMGHRNIIVNFSEVKYIDSSIINALLTGRRLCDNLNGLLVIASPSPSVSRLIDISHLYEGFPIFPTQEEAKEAIYMHEIEREILTENGEAKAE